MPELLTNMCSGTFKKATSYINLDTNEIFKPKDFQHFVLGWERYNDIKNWCDAKALKDGIYFLSLTGAGFLVVSETYENTTLRYFDEAIK